MKTHLPSALILLSLLFFSVVPAFAQDAAISGRVLDQESRESLPRATVQLYRLSTSNQRKDTTLVEGVLSDDDGHFSFQSVTNGQYLLKVSYFGYEEISRTLRKTREPIALGNLTMKVNAKLLDEAVVTANIPKMVVKDDTLVYNADAFRVPEGSVIEALVEALPGAKIDDNGGVTINGKSVKRFKMDGRDYMTGNNDAVMKNLPSYVVDQVKAYEEKSDLAQLTGIDDGNEDFILEFVTKRSARNGLQMNPDLGVGTHHRYGVRLTAMKPFGDIRYTFMGNANNVNDRNFTGRGGRGRGNNNGQRHSKTAALDASYENGQKLKMSGRITWSHNNTDNWNRTGSETFVNTRGGAFSNSISQSFSRANSWTGNMNLQWQIDSLTNLSFRPNFNISTNDSRNHSTSASFNANPFDYTTDPLDEIGLQTMDDLDLIVNSRLNKSMSYSSNQNFSSQLQLFRRLNRRGRNMTLNTNIDYRNGKNDNANLSAVHLYQTFSREGNDSTYQTNRYSKSPSNNFSITTGFSYTEPLLIIQPKPQVVEEGMPGEPGGFGGGPGGGPFGDRGRGGRQSGLQGLFLQTNYRFRYNHQKSDPLTYDFPDYTDEAFMDVLRQYRDWARLFGYLNNPYESYLSQDLSRYSERTEREHNIDVQLRYVREKLNMNVGVSIQPQRSHFIQQYLGIPVDTTRTVTNFTPTLNLRYRFNRQTNLNVTYRGSTSQPSITQLLNIYDDTNPLSITMGNPGLKPSLTNNLNANFQKQRTPKYRTDTLGMSVPVGQRHWSYNINGSFQRTHNSIGNVVTYNEETGGRISRPENINGNWNANGGATFNIALDTLNRWDFSGSLRGNYSHQVAYVNINRTAIPDRNVTHSYNLSPQVSLSFRNSWLNISANYNTTYAHTHNRLQASNNLTTWNHQYGANARITFPWGTNLSTDIHMNSKRGYSDPTLNTNELLWNAQISHSFLRGKPLTIMLQWYDILNQQSNFTRTINANGWTDREVNAITSYAMIHISYRYNMFGNGNRGQGGGRGQSGRGGRDRQGGGSPGGGFPGGGFPGGGFPGRGGN